MHGVLNSLTELEELGIADLILLSALVYNQLYNI